MSASAPLVARVVVGLRLLFTLDRRAFKAFGGRPKDARRSFLAALIVLPLYLYDFPGLDNVRGVFSSEDQSSGGWACLAVALLHYSLLWTLVPVVVDVVARAFDRGVLYYRWLSAYNWLTMTFWLVTFPIGLLLQQASLADSAAVGLLVFGVPLVEVFYLGVVVRMGLRLALSTTVAIVAIDVILTVGLFGILSRVLAACGP